MAGIPRRTGCGPRPRACARDHAEPAEALQRTAPRCSDGSDHGLHQHHRPGERARVPRRRGDRAPLPRLDPLERRHHSCTARSVPASPSAATSRPTRRAPRSTRSASTTSSAARTTRAAATRSSSRATPPPAPTPAPSSRAASAPTSSTASARRSRTRAAASRRTRTRVSCRSSGSSRPCRWVSARSTRSTRRSSTSTSPTAASRMRATSRSGRSSATARWTRSRAAASSRSRPTRGLDNLTFVINANLQRLDGPVRGNGKIIQELESFFRGAGWNVIKVIWGREWDDLLARDTDGALAQPDEPARRTATTRPTRPRTAPTCARTSSVATRAPSKLVKDYTDDQVWNLKRGGHDYRKVYAAFKAASRAQGPAHRHHRARPSRATASARASRAATRPTR